MQPQTRPLWQRFVLFLLPMMASNVLQSMSGTINNIYVGQLLGVEALAAVSVFFPLMIFMISFLVGIASGASILIGQAWGARDLEKIKRINGTTLTVALVAGIFVAIFGSLFARQLMELLGAPPNIIAEATQYSRIMFIGMPGFFIFMIITSMLRGVGDTVTPLIALSLSIVGGLVVTPALILGWLGLPPMGISAAAIAFIVGFMVVLVFLFFYLNWRRSPLAPDAALLRRLGVDWRLLGTVLRLGVPAGVSMVVASVAAIVIVGIVNSFGSNATAAYGAVNQVMGYVQFPAMSVGISAAILAAHAIGARQMEEVERITRTGLVVNLVVTGGFVLIAYLFSEHLVRLFITSEEVIALTESLLHIVLWSVIMSGFAQVYSAVMRASGDVIIPMLLSLVAIIGIELPGALILSETMGLPGVWVAYAAAFSSMLLLQAVYYYAFWRKKEIKALV